ncbi:MAG: hypothetical protein ACOYL5_09615 [Phototrophicaceae bacterium]
MSQSVPITQLRAFITAHPDIAAGVLDNWIKRVEAFTADMEALGFAVRVSQSEMIPGDIIIELVRES